MELLKTHHTEQRQRQLIIDVATGVSDLVEVASLNNLDLEELQHWVQLYQTHGEGILSPEQLPKAKLELFKLKLKALGGVEREDGLTMLGVERQATLQIIQAQAHDTRRISNRALIQEDEPDPFLTLALLV